ncbi:MAG: hypothetical protein AUG44_02855 [Actinobacteria bacterium 13_1_20CM_3_71_11]|nr:MAG: hypothetical protein AUG44_02855 [Actinobacteria bacterium 13_1_20CM_3_71_11]
MAEAAEVKTVPWWVGPAFGILALGTVPWVIFLAVTLPRHATFAHYRGVWVGFDTGLVVVLAMTAYLAWRARPHVALSATAAATMLLVDAWFDVLTTPRGHGWLMSVVLAGLIELPLASICPARRGAGHPPWRGPPVALTKAPVALTKAPGRAGYGRPKPCSGGPSTGAIVTSSPYVGAWITRPSPM